MEESKDNKDTRESIIDHSFNLFLNHNYEAVSISDISEAIGFTKGAIYHHFKNKEELFVSVIDKYFNVSVHTLGAYDNISLRDFVKIAVKNAKAGVNALVGEKQSIMPLNYLSLIIDAMRHYPDFIRKKDVFFNSEIVKIETILENAVKSGEIRSDINVHVMAVNFFSIILGVATNILHNNSTEKSLVLLDKQLKELYKLLKA